MKIYYVIECKDAEGFAVLHGGTLNATDYTQAMYVVERHIMPTIPHKIVGVRIYTEE